MGGFNFRNTEASFDGINAKLKNASGSLKFNDKNTYFETKNATLNDKIVKINGTCSLKGILDFNISGNQDLMNLLSILKTSRRLTEFRKQIPEIKKAQGEINVKLNLKGRKLMIL